MTDPTPSVSERLRNALNAATGEASSYADDDLLLAVAHAYLRDLLDDHDSLQRELADARRDAARLADAASQAADFLVGHGDVAELAAKRLRAAQQEPPHG